MRVNNYSVLVPEGTERDSGHVELRHNTIYSVRLGNHDANRDCDAEVVVDGKTVGAFRLRAGFTFTLERPAHDDGRFTFYEANSQQAQDAGAAKIATDDRGLIQVVFRPEKKILRRMEREEKTSGGIIMPKSVNFVTPTSGVLRGAGGQSQNYSAGVTGLSGKSAQQFVDVPNLDYEPNAEVTISLRLVASRAVRELTAVPQSNSVPQPV